MDDVDAELKDFFQLNYRLSELYSKWSLPAVKSSERRERLNADFAQVGAKLKGLRLLRQKPLECLVSFLCSQNNNIPRIKLMLSQLCAKYGTALGDVDGEVYHAFPSLVQLRKADESTLRELGFGYRAKYLPRTIAQIVENGGEQWLEELRTKNVAEVRKELTTLMGIGEKVADCVALFSLDQLSLVPVDTHVFQIAQRYITLKAVTPKSRLEVAELFLTAFGSLAGWAHTILFASEIAAFQKLFTMVQKPYSPAGDEQIILNNGKPKIKGTSSRIDSKKRGRKQREVVDEEEVDQQSSPKKKARLK
jgi:N-glycosylase/DNA lyase